MSIDKVPPAVYELLELLSHVPHLAHEDVPPELCLLLGHAYTCELLGTQDHGLDGEAWRWEYYRHVDCMNGPRVYWITQNGRDVLAWHRTRPKDAQLLPAPVPDMETDKPTIWYHGERSYSLDGTTPEVVGEEMHNLLRAFLDHDRSLATKALTGVSNPATAVTNVERMFGPGPVTRPKSRGRKKGGYYIRVRSKPC